MPLPYAETMSKKSRHSAVASNVFTWLDQVRECPRMHARTLDELESQIWGYYVALSNHGIIETVPSMQRHFLTWVAYRTRWSTSCGWATAIDTHIADPEKRFAKFFRLVDEYRQLKPKVLCTALLSKQHVPTGKRVIIGLDGRMEKPKRVDIVQYAPEPLHFLRFHYTTKIVDNWILMTSVSSYDTTIYDAKRWCRDELQIKRDEWLKAS